jgi:hypothetical protein
MEGQETISPGRRKFHFATKERPVQRTAEILDERPLHQGGPLSVLVG